MSIQRIESKASHTRGWQARAYVPGQRRRLTRFFADDSHGGMLGAYDQAAAVLDRLQVQAVTLAKRGVRRG